MRLRASVHWLGLALLLLWPAPRAAACGVSSVDGSWSCSWADYDEAVRPRWQLGAAALHTRTRLRFEGDWRATQFRNAIVATAAYAPTARLSLQLNLGAAIGGELQTPRGAYRFSPGPTFAAGASYTLLPGSPFLVLTGVLAASVAESERGDESPTYTAIDARFGVAFGVTLFERLSPYAVARAFGGPVFFRYRGESVTGTDVYHVQLGAGLSVRPIDQLVVFIEGIPLGERALSGGASFAF